MSDRFEILCVTMHRENCKELFLKMNIHSNVIFANQSDHYEKHVEFINGFRVVTITTDTRGNGLNRNIALLNAQAEICLLADDDMEYNDNYEHNIINEFDLHPEADVIVFNIGTSTPEYGRIPTQIKKYKKMNTWSRNPYGAPRIAFRLASIRKANVYFSLLFGGGSPFSNGQDSIFLRSLQKQGLKVYLSPIFIGNVSYEGTTWYNADVEKKLYGKGAVIEATPSSSINKTINMFYTALIRRPKDYSVLNTMAWLKRGRIGFHKLISYEELEGINNKKEIEQ